jgi:N-acetylneuraminic acid mutarotase
MIAWGGTGSDLADRSDGAAYDPEKDSWSPISADGAPSARYEAVSAWTGKKLLIWGGIHATKVGTSFATEYLRDGASYDPVTDSWAPINATGAPSGRWPYATAWTGSEFVVWGGFPHDNGMLVNDGAAYNPDTDTWRAIAPAPDPPPNGPFVWTGTELFVWGNPGARYNPASNTWSVMRTEGQPSGDRALNVTVWTGKEMIVWGGSVRPKDALNDGARYTP